MRTGAGHFSIAQIYYFLRIYPARGALEAVTLRSVEKF